MLALISGHDAAKATTFAPEYSVTLSSTTPSTNANITVDYLLATPQTRESHHVSFMPSQFGVATGASVLNGADVGMLSLTLTESQTNAACSDASFLSFTLLDASTNTGDTISDTPRIPSASWPGFLDASPANSLPDAVDKYPAFLNTMFPGLTPRARSFAWIPASIGTVNRAVNVLTFEPGTPLPGMNPIPASLGYITVIVEQDPTAPAAAATITDSCSEYRWVRTDRGITANNPDTTSVNEGGAVYRTNPAADGGYVFFEYGRTFRDFDDDNIENQLDTCPTVGTPTWDPRSPDPVDDPDGDGIPGKDNLGMAGEQLLAGSGCDPTPLTAGADPDADGIQNRQDNCPLVANATQVDPDGDGIGSACDTVDTAGDGHLHEVCVSDEIDIGAGGVGTVPACLEFVLDMDNDGFSRVVEQHVGTDEEDPCGQASWPADLNSTSISTNDIDILDLSTFMAPVRRLDTSPGNPDYNVRWDLIPGSTFGEDINITDLAAITTLYPPMLEGQRAFNGPACPYAP